MVATLVVWPHTNVHKLVDFSRYDVKLVDGVGLYVVTKILFSGSIALSLYIANVLKYAISTIKKRISLKLRLILYF